MIFNTIDKWYEALARHQCEAKSLIPADNPSPSGHTFHNEEETDVIVFSETDQTVGRAGPTFGYCCTGCGWFAEIELKNVKACPPHIKAILGNVKGRIELAKILSKNGGVHV